MKEFNKLIIKKLNQLLKNTNITQAELGDGISISRTTINNWANNRSKIDAVSL